MINIIFTPVSVTVEGHSGYAPAGEDIICAGVSALFQTLALSINSLTKDKADIMISKGMSYIKFKNENPSEQACLLIDSFFIGVSEIQESYGAEYLNIKDADGR